MRRLGWAALGAAGTLLLAGQAGAAVVYFESGALSAPVCSPAFCRPGSFDVGGDGPFRPLGGYLNNPRSDFQGAGAYHWELDLDPSLIHIDYVDVPAFDSWDEYWNGAYSGGQDSPLTSSAPYTVTATGIEGFFTVAPIKDQTYSTHVLTLNASGGFDDLVVEVRRIDRYYTGVQIHGSVLSGAGTPYTFRITAIPEPTAWAMMLVGFFGVGTAIRWRRSVGATDRMRFPKRAGLAALCAAVGMAAAGQASAAIVAGVSDNGLFHRSLQDGGAYREVVEVILGADAVIDGFDIYSDPHYASLGQSVLITIRPDASGVPSDTPLFEFTDTIDTLTEIDANNDFVGAHFSGINLSAGTYWFGLSSLGEGFGWNTFNYNDIPFPSGQAVLFNGNYTPITKIDYTLGFALESGGLSDADVQRFIVNTGPPVPEPATWALMLLGFSGLGVALRRRHAVGAAP